MKLFAFFSSNSKPLDREYSIFYLRLSIVFYVKIYELKFESKSLLRYMNIF